MVKRFRNLFLCFIMIFTLVACSSSNSNEEEVKISTIDDLMANIEGQSGDEEGDLSPVDEQAKNDVKKEDVKDKWEKSIARAKKEEEEAKKRRENLTSFEDSKARTKREDSKSNNEEEIAEDTNKEEKTARIKFFGDTMAHLGQIQYAYNYGGGTYDFSNQYYYISDFVKDADLAITNYETTSNPNREYTGYPRFNTPETYPKAIKDAGFDVVTTANNHSLDTDEEGIFTTIDAIENAGLDYVGTHEEGGDRVLYKEVNGIKIAILSYTYGTNGLEDLLTPREEVPYINYLHEDEIKKDIEEAKKNKADFIIAYPHWGIEYQSYPEGEIIELARSMVEWGVDLVIGNHPHVVQPMERYKAEDGREGLIAYSLGNYISIQSLENNNDIRVEQSVAYEVSLNKDGKDKKIADIKIHPLWVGSTYDDYGQSIKTYLCEDFLDGGKYYNEVDENQRSRIKEAYDMTMETVTSEVSQ
ncbi:MAG: CapA family protein [Anaerococcus sp.]|nr:CapA family protein [Anaerococcus sp.]